MAIRKIIYITQVDFPEVGYSKENLRKILDALHLSGYAFAKRFELPLNSVSKYLNGTTEMSLKNWFFVLENLSSEEKQTIGQFPNIGFTAGNLAALIAALGMQQLSFASRHGIHKLYINQYLKAGRQMKRSQWLSIMELYAIENG